MGRPSEYTSEIAEKICAMLAEGRSLRSICAEAEMPCMVTVYRWMRVHQDFSNLYARAREDQADTLADEIAEIADDGSRDYVVDKDGKLIVDHDHIQRSKLRVDARKWIASKLKPKKYGERIDATLRGDPQEPIAVQIVQFSSGQRST